MGDGGPVQEVLEVLEEVAGSSPSEGLGSKLSAANRRSLVPKIKTCRHSLERQRGTVGFHDQENELFL